MLSSHFQNRACSAGTFETPLSWKFGKGTIRTEPHEKYLSLVVSVSGSWTPHFDSRIAKAKKAFYGLLNAGLLGGAKLCADIAKAAILPVLDSCKSATNYVMRGNKGKFLTRARLTEGAVRLGAASYASSARKPRGSLPPETHISSLPHLYETWHEKLNMPWITYSSTFGVWRLDYVCSFFGSKERMRFIVALANLINSIHVPYLQCFQPLASSQ
jgi:hypothetical protein